MAKIKLVVSASIEETFSDFIISKKTKGLAEKTLQSYQSQFQAVARHMDVKMDIGMLQKADNPKRSAYSVAKYIKMEGVSRNIRIAVENLLRETK